MTRSAAERTSPRAIPQQSPVSPPPDVGLRGQQLALIDVSGGRGTGQEGLDLPGEIASLERELRYYRRVIYSISRILAEQPQLEFRLEALERAHRRIRDEGAQLFDDEPDEREADPGMFGSSWSRAGLWVRAGLVALILVIVAIVSVPDFIDWWQAVIQPRHG